MKFQNNMYVQNTYNYTKNDICEIVTYDQQITVNGHNYAPVLHQNCMQPEQITLYPLVIRQEHATLTVSDRYHTGHWNGDAHRFPTGVQSLCTGDVCHVPIAEGVSTFYILFQPKCNRRFIFTWSVIYFTVFYANSMTYYLKNLGSASSQGSKVHYGELPPSS